MTGNDNFHFFDFPTLQAFDLGAEWEALEDDFPVLVDVFPVLVDDFPVFVDDFCCDLGL